jgi:hypothetical protein
MKLPVYVYVDINVHNKEIKYTSLGWESDNCSFGTVCNTTEIEVPAVDYDTIVTGKVRQLKEQQQAIKAEAQTRVTQIGDLISSLLAIEDKSNG